jgi:hypothetical protein
MNKELGEPNDLYPRPKNIVQSLSEKSERIAWSSNLTLKKLENRLFQFYFYNLFKIWLSRE